MNLLLAIHAEHKARTGHDIITRPNKFSNCDVCTFLWAESRDQEKIKAEYYKSLEGVPEAQ